MRKFLLFFLSFMFVIFNTLHAEKKVFTYNYSYAYSPFDTKDTARIIAMEKFTDYYKKEIEKYLDKQKEIRVFSYSSSDLQALISGIYLIAITTEKSSDTSISFTTSVTIDTEEMALYVQKVKNYPDTLQYFHTINKNIEQAKDQIDSFGKKHSTKEVAIDTQNTLKTDYTQLVKSLHDLIFLRQLTCVYMARHNKRFFELLQLSSEVVSHEQQIMFFKAIILAEQKDYASAQKEMDAMISRMPNDTMTPYYASLIRAKITHNKKELPLKQSYYDQALKIQPNLTEPLFERALLLISIKKPQLALTDIDNFLKNSPFSADALFYRGIILDQLSKSKEAQDSMTKAVRYGHKEAAKWLNKIKQNHIKEKPIDREI